jgi:hypothetical protein
MKKITVTLSDEAEKVFNDIMYSLAKEEDGTGMCTQSEAINHALVNYQELIDFFDIEDVVTTDENYLENKNK